MGNKFLLQYPVEFQIVEEDVGLVCEDGRCILLVALGTRKPPQAPGCTRDQNITLLF
jgi:hypothetical protein